MKIITIPEFENRLRQKSKKIDPALIMNPDMQKFFDELEHTMFKADGLGLASPQVDNPIQAVAVNIEGTAHIFINPEISKKSWFKNVAEEGCLSIPGRYGNVKRHKWINLNYLDRHGKKHSEKFSALTARILQHEIDHLRGILFIDKLVKQ
jgi:peptide deformylase